MPHQRYRAIISVVVCCTRALAASAFSSVRRVRTVAAAKHDLKLDEISVSMVCVWYSGSDIFRGVGVAGQQPVRAVVRGGIVPGCAPLRGIGAMRGRCSTVCRGRDPYGSGQPWAQRRSSTR